MAEESKENKTRRVDVNTNGIVRDAFLGQSFLTFNFFKRNWIYVVALTVMMLMYISNKYVCQDCLQQVMKLSVQLDNAKTDCVNASAKYNSMIRESHMTAFVDTMRLDLTSPEQPPYNLDEK